MRIIYSVFIGAGFEHDIHFVLNNQILMFKIAKKLELLQLKWTAKKRPLACVTLTLGQLYVVLRCQQTPIMQRAVQPLDATAAVQPQCNTIDLKISRFRLNIT